MVWPPEMTPSTPRSMNTDSRPAPAHQLFGTDQDLDALLNKLAQSEEMQDAEFISVFYGEDVNEEKRSPLQKLRDIFE